MPVRRLLILLAVLMGLIALAAGVAPRETVDPPESAQTAPSPGAAVPEPTELRLSTGPSGEEERLQATTGETVRLTVDGGDDLDSVAVGELGIEPIAPDSPAVFELLLDVPGSYPITLLGSGRRIGTLEVAG